jgi:hypothetical protein
MMGAHRSPSVASRASALAETGVGCHLDDHVGSSSDSMVSARTQAR